MAALRIRVGRPYCFVQGDEMRERALIPQRCQAIDRTNADDVCPRMPGRRLDQHTSYVDSRFVLPRARAASASTR